MKTLAALFLAVTALSGCVAVPYDSGPAPRGYYDGRPPPPRVSHDRDRDRDGVPNNYDRRPDNPYRY